MAKKEEKRDILVITADAVKFNGQISFMFMVEADRKGKLRPMPQRYGYVWQEKPNEASYIINVFEGSKGLVVVGGWSDSDDFKWAQQICDSIPSCTLLMDIDLLPWWKGLTEKHGIEYRYYHFEGILYTSQNKA